MSYCPKCGSKFESGRFRCPKCGSPLAFQAERRGPTLWQRLKKYRSYLILLAVAIVIASTKAAFAVTGVFWLLAIGLLGALLVTWLRSRNRGFGTGRPQGPQPPRYGSAPPANSKRPANVIPFKKKREDKLKAKRD